MMMEQEKAQACCSAQSSAASTTPTRRGQTMRVGEDVQVGPELASRGDERVGDGLVDERADKLHGQVGNVERHKVGEAVDPPCRLAPEDCPLRPCS